MPVTYNPDQDLGTIEVQVTEGVSPNRQQLQFQHGTISENGRNGIFNEELIELLILRLQHFNSTEMKCRENSLAITKLEEALHWLNHRTALREAQGVEDSMTPHNS